MQTLNSHTLVVVALLLTVCGSGCRASFHRVPKEEWLGPYRVSVRPYCDSSRNHSLAEYDQDSKTSIVSYEFTCGDTKIAIRSDMLSVDGKSYGTVARGDWIAVDYGKVRVNSEVRAEVR